MSYRYLFSKYLAQLLYTMHKIIVVLILTGLVSVNSISTTCSSVQKLTDAQIWQLFTFSAFDTYFIYTIGSLSIICLALALITWIPYRSFQLPSDIVFVILAAQFVDTLSLLVMTIYYSTNKGQIYPVGFGTNCRSMGSFNMIGNIVSLYYNAFFCAALAYSINNTLKQPFLSKFKSHLLCLVAVISAIFVVIFMSNSGSPLSGICIFRLANESSLGLFLLHLLIFIVCIYSLMKFKSKIPKNTFFQQQTHFGYYYTYMIIFSIFQGINTLLYLFGNIFCQAEMGNLSSILKVLYSISVVLSIALNYATVTIRFAHPNFLMKIKRIIGIQSIPINQEEEKDQDLNWIDSLVQSIKGSQILSFIQAIMINYIQNSNKFPQNLTPYHFQRQYSFLLNQHIAEDYVRRRITNRDSHFVRQASAGLKTLTYQVLIYTPEFFSWLYRSQNINLFKSFDIRKNLSLVKQQSYTEGGKSGEFFFGTYDNNFIFKTIQSEQAEVFLAKTQQYYQYISNNTDSLLIKILGLYRFTRKDIKQDPIYIILMKNLTLSHKRHNLRVYDIKGSQFNRSTLEEKRIKVDNQQKLRQFTLKDKDFLVVQKKIDIDPQKAIQLKKKLKRDIQFLENFGVMDYSLLIIKREGPPTNQQGQFESIKEKGIYFNLGIIDYLQEWTLRRKAQRMFKTLITSEQVTANSPKSYSKRLIQFIDQIL